MSQERFVSMFLSHYPEYNRLQVVQALEGKVPNPTIAAEWDSFQKTGKMREQLRIHNYWQEMMAAIKKHFPSYKPIDSSTGATVT